MPKISRLKEAGSRVSAGMKLWAPIILTFATITAIPAARAQGSPDGPPPPMRSNRPPMERAFHGPGGPGRDGMGRWWDNPQVAKDLNLDPAQQKKMDDIFQQSRLKLIDLHASLQKEEATLEPLLSADTPDEGKVLSQIDKVASARAELEKSNARMLLAIRQVLTPDQWTKLKEKRANRMGHDQGGRGPDRAPGMGDHPGMDHGPGGSPGGDSE